MPGPIPWRDVRGWCEFHDMPGDAVPFLDTCCRLMDAEYLAWHARETERALKVGRHG